MGTSVPLEHCKNVGPIVHSCISQQVIKTTVVRQCREYCTQRLCVCVCVCLCVCVCVCASHLFSYLRPAGEEGLKVLP